MAAQTHDTIAALSSAPGPGGRAIVRLSGPSSSVIVSAVFAPVDEFLLGQRCLVAGAVQLGMAAPLPADLYFWPGPRSYTGQDMAELHTLSCPPLVERLVAELLRAGARAALPGEFTLRAFLAGKLDLTRAEAVQGVIEAGSRAELRQALGQLAGGMARPLQELRDDLLNLLADVEAALDFADEDIRFVDQKETLLRLGKALAHVTLVGKQLDARAVAGRAFRVALAGLPNAGKSRLFNALTGGQALVSPQPGTTRDYLVGALKLGDVVVELIDTPGWQVGADTVSAQAQALGREQAGEANLILFCQAADESAVEIEVEASAVEKVRVATKCDLARASVGWLATSAVTGEGLNELRALLAARARTREQPALAPSVSRCRHHVESCLGHLRRAHRLVLEEDPPELLALELREALEQLGEMVGAVYTEDLLDRIFSRFCIGK